MASKAMKAAVPELTEKQIQAQIVEYLRWHGWFVSEIRERYSNGTGRYSDPGIPDVVAIKDGRTIWLEVKTSKGKVRPSQLKWHEECRKHGGEVQIIRSSQAVNEQLMNANYQNNIF